MIQLHADIANLPQVDAKFAALDREISTLKPLWERFGTEFYSQESALFDAQPWAPLSPAYAAKKQEIYGDKPILRATDALFKSFTEQGATGNIHRVNDLDAEFGSNDPKAMFHFTGTSRMPQRNPLAEPDVDKYETIAGEYLGEMVSKAGFN